MAAHDRSLCSAGRALLSAFVGGARHRLADLIEALLECKTIQRGDRQAYEKLDTIFQIGVDFHKVAAFFFFRALEENRILDSQCAVRVGRATPDKLPERPDRTP